MALFDRETDPAKERDGVPFDRGEYEVTLRRRGGTNDRFDVELSRLMKPHRVAQAAGVFSHETQTECTARAFIRSCIVRWRTWSSAVPGYDPGRDGEPKLIDGIQNRDGTIVPATEETMLPALTGGMTGELEELLLLSTREQAYRLLQREDDAGN
jgi:hypothetical protein